MNRKHLVALFVVVWVAKLPASEIIVQWDFNGPSAMDIPGGSLSPLPSIGAGTASLLGSTTSPGFFSGTANLGSSDPVTTAPPNYAWQTTSFPTQGQDSGTAGVRFAVDTTGFSEIQGLFDLRMSNTASRWYQVRYSTDGTNFQDWGSPIRLGEGDVSAGEIWFNQLSFDFSAIGSAGNNPNFGFEVVSVFSPDEFTEHNSGILFAANTAYESARNRTMAPNSAYGAAGTWRFDMVTLRGTLGEPTPNCDFTGSGTCNGTDIDLLMAAIASGANDPAFDLTGDGLVNLADRDAWLQSAGNLNIGAPYLLADFTLDGVVDGQDFVVWNSNKFTNNSDWTSGNSNGDNVVDGQDFIDWNNHKFMMSGGAPPVVPEPNALLVLLLGLGVLVRRSLLPWSKR